MSRVFGVSSLVLLIACGGREVAIEPAPAVAPSAAVTPAPDPVASSTQPTLPAPKDDAITCESLSKLPALATFSIDEDTVGNAALTLVDAFVTETTYQNDGADGRHHAGRRFSLTLTMQAQTCAVRASNVQPHGIGERSVGFAIDQVDTTEPPPSIGVGTYETGLSVSELAGQCAAEGETQAASGGGAWQVHGAVTITSHTDTEVAGTVDVQDDFGKRLKVAFRAPLCDDREPATAKTCCAQ